MSTIYLHEYRIPSLHNKINSSRSFVTHFAYGFFHRYRFKPSAFDGFAANRFFGNDNDQTPVVLPFLPTNFNHFDVDQASELVLNLFASLYSSSSPSLCTIFYSRSDMVAAEKKKSVLFCKLCTQPSYIIFHSRSL